MPVDRNDIVSKIKKLSDKARSAEKIGSEAEAQAFAAKAAELMRQHAVTQREVEASGEDAEEIGKTWVNWAKHGMKNTSRRCQWVERLARTVTTCCGCDFYIILGTNTIVIVGPESSAKIAEYMLVTLTRAAKDISLKEYDKYWHEVNSRGEAWRARGFKASFLQGLVRKVCQRIEDMLDPNGGDTEALTYIGNQLARVRAYKSTLGLESSNRLAVQDGNHAGRLRGEAIGSTMHLGNKGVGATQPTVPLLE